jgi:CRISPR-associated protein Cas1
MWELRALAQQKEERRGTLVLAGHGAGLFVEKGALIVKEGLTHYPQEVGRHVFHRGMHNVERIILLDPTGSLSFAAIQWCQDQKISITLLDRDGSVQAQLNHEQMADATLRRRQYEAVHTGQDVTVVRWIVQKKIEGQPLP